MEKVIRDSHVAVLYSPGYGAGWFTWNENHKELLFHPKLVEMVEQNRNSEINEDWVKDNLGIANVYTEGAEDLRIEWIPQGTRFIINEYDGSESIHIYDNNSLVA